MVMQNVPWAIEASEVYHSGDVARSLAFFSAPVHGVGLPGDLKVTPVSPAGLAVQVAGGTVAVPSTYAGHESETYIAKNVGVERMELAPTGAQGRRDLIVVEIRDPQYGTTPEGDDPTRRQYSRITVVQAGPAGLTPESVLKRANPTVLLAEVNLPANCQAVTGSMIRSLRRVARPLVESGVVQSNPSGSSTGGTKFAPKGSAPQSLTHTPVTVPGWATTCIVEVTMNGVRFGLTSGVLVAGVRVYATDNFNNGRPPLGHQSENGIVTQEAASNNWNLRQTVAMSGKLDVSKWQGRTITIGMTGLMSTGGEVAVDYQSAGTIKYTFQGEAI